MAWRDYNPIIRRERGYSDLLPSSMGLERLFDSLLSGEYLPGRQNSQLSEFSPRINVSEDEKEIRVVAELPGMKEDDIEISFTSGGLLLTGEKQEEKRDGGRNQYYECTYGSFERFIPLNNEVKESEATASFERGVLMITLPKTEEARSRRRNIPIKGAAARGEDRSQQIRGEGRDQESRSSKSRS